MLLVNRSEGEPAPASVRRAGIVAVQKPGFDSRKVVHDLKQKRIIAAPRQGWVRMSPHFYISPEEIDRFLAEL